MQTENEQKVARKFSQIEWCEIADKLESHHALFQKLWEMGKPNFTYDLPTAAVYFDKLGDCIDFNINPDFWDTLDEQQKLFVICHECMHVALLHGYRINGLKTKQEMQIANLALDVVVNHFLTDNLGFDRAAVDPPTKEQPKGNYCWIDTVFEDQKMRPFTGESFEYYYNLIKKDVEKNPNGKAGEMSSMDDHGGLGSFVGGAFDKKMKDSMTNTEQQSLDGSKELKKEAKKEADAEASKQKKNGDKQAGNNPGDSWVLAKNIKVLPKRRWEQTIKTWAKAYDKEKVAEQWVRENRRMSSLPKDLCLPSEFETDEYEKSRIKVLFFLDTSGSCAHLAERFFNAAASLPADRFDVELCCFDTKVYETDLKSRKLLGFGCTSFSVLSNYVNEKTKTNKKHHDAIFVLTDGYGDAICPEKPHRWQWFLSEDYRQYIPKECTVHKLSDYE